MPLLRLRSKAVCALALALLASSSIAAEPRQAPNPAATPVNQLAISGNACGPAAIIASFRSGDANWQAPLKLLPQDGDKAQMLQWIKTWGLQPSASLPGRKRWTGAGINVDDLVAATNEMTRGLYLPPVKSEDLFLSTREDSAKLLGRVHDHLDRSLSKGVPPVLSLRRYALRGGAWTFLQGHFVTVVSVRKIDGSAFPISYLDPWGGKRADGFIRIPTIGLLPLSNGKPSCLEAVLPAANVGKSQVGRKESTAIVPAAVIGRW